MMRSAASKAFMRVSTGVRGEDGETQAPGCRSMKMRRRTPGLSIDDLQLLARNFRETAKTARKAGDTVKADRFEQKAIDYEERARKASEKLTPKPS